MLSFHSNAQRFNLRAAAIVLNDDYVLLHRAKCDPFWALPGGRVEIGECASKTIVREMQEELSEKVTCGPLTHVIENFFVYAGEKHHELGMYFIVSLVPDSLLLNKERVHAGHEGPRQLEFRWFSQEQIPKINIAPKILSQVLASPVSGVHHLVVQAAE